MPLDPNKDPNKTEVQRRSNKASRVVGAAAVLLTLAVVWLIFGGDDEQVADGPDLESEAYDEAQLVDRDSAPFEDEEVVGEARMAGDAGEITDLAQLAAETPDMLVDRAVSFQDVTVTERLGERSFRIGDELDEPVLVVLDEGVMRRGDLPVIEDGAMIDVEGVILGADAGVTPARQNLGEDAGMFVYAMSVGAD